MLRAGPGSLTTAVAFGGTTTVNVVVVPLRAPPGQPLDTPEPVREHLPVLKALMTDAPTALR